jgi:phenylalanyl-tRNA synthetase beta chain
LVTEASYRFERQVDYGNCLAALGRLVVLVQKEAGGKLDGVVDFDHTKPREAIKLPLSQIERLIGQSYERRKVVELLERLGCRVEEGTDNLPVVPPTWRPDLTIAVDLVEELARLSGYDTVTTQPLPTPQRVKSLAYETNESLKDELVERGLSEVMTYSLLGEKDLAVAGTPKQEAVAIANPLSSELAYFRPCLLPGLLKAAAKNPTYDPIRIFEIGRVATKRGESIELGILFAGRNAKQLVDLAKTYGLTANEVSLTLKDAYKLRKQAVYVAIGPLKRSVKSVHVRLLTSPKRFTVKPISKFPPVVRDISFIVSETIRTDEIKTAISEVSPQIYLVELFDEFKGTTVGAGRKSLAFHIYYQSPDKTLTKDEIDHLHQSVALLLATRYDAKVR